MPVRVLSAFPGRMQMAQTAAEGLDLLLVGGLLPLGQLQSLQHFIHVLQGSAEGLDNMAHLFDSLLDCSGRCRLPLAGGWGRNLLLNRSRL